MASLDWSQCPAVESVPGKRSGHGYSGTPGRPSQSCLTICKRERLSAR